ncbi:MAG TPA: T9SS type A sorting domain-containing protein, partial [Saprospiraceae bacterium]|nr:T9SS type A sorting domain-containing protein [Saprospiraceae bacterium]
HQFSGQYFEAELPFAAVSTEFDPQLWLVSRNNTVTNNPAVSVDEVETFRVRWFPNPAADVLTLDWPGFEGAPVRGECVDAAGRKVFAFEVTSAQSTFSLRGMPAGTYTMRLFTPKGTQLQVIVKQ